MTIETVIPSGAEQARRLEAVYAQLVQRLSTPAAIQAWQAAESGKEWSVTEVLGHMVEMIPYWLASCQVIVTASTPPSFGRTGDDPERLAAVKRGANTSPQTLLKLLQHEVQQAATTIRAMSDAQRSKTGIHLLRGEMSIAEIVEVLVVAHAESHLVQIQTAL